MANVFLDGQQNLSALTVPGVYGDIILPTPLLIGTPTNIEGLVGVASWGPVNSLIPATQSADAALSLGPPVVRTHDIASHIAAATQVGGAIGFQCVRVTDGTDTAAQGTVLAAGVPATGSITFTTNPTNNNTVTLNGVAVTFVTSGASGPQINIGANLQASLTALVNYINATATMNVNFIAVGTQGTVLNLTAVVGGTAGNSLTIATTVTGTTVSGSGSMAGGASGGTGLTLTGKYTGILGNKISISLQNGTMLNTYIAVVAFPGLAPQQFMNVPTGNVNASGSILFTQNPVANTTVTLGSTVVTFVTSGATGNQVNIGATLQATLQNLALFLNGSTDVNLSAARYSTSLATTTLNITYKTAGTLGNTFTVATNVSGATVSASTLANGAAGGNTFWVNLAAAINSGNAYGGPSNTTVATAGAGTGAPILSSPITLSGGTDGATGVTDATIVGVDVLPRTGCFVLRSAGCDSFTPIDLSNISYWAALVSLALSETMLAIVSTQSGTAYATTINDRDNAGVDSPWIWILNGDWPSFYDSYNGVSRLINPTAFAIGIVGNLSPQQSPLNKPLQGISATQTSTLGETYGETDLSLINQGGIDTILPATQSPGGFYYSFATGRNASSNTAANGVEYTRMTNFLMRTAQSKAAGSFIGRLQSIQPNDQTRSDAKSLFDGLSAQLASPEVGLGINGQGMIDTPWLVQCDLNNNPPNLQALGYLFLYWQVRYLNVVRYFVVKFQGGGNVTVNVQSTAPTVQQLASQ